MFSVTSVVLTKKKVLNYHQILLNYQEIFLIFVLTEDTGQVFSGLPCLNGVSESVGESGEKWGKEFAYQQKMFFFLPSV